MSVNKLTGLDTLAKQIIEAEITGKVAVSPLTGLKSDLTLDEAYKVQFLVNEYKVGKGHQIVGKKIGLTSAVMQQEYGIDTPDCGHLFDYMEIKNNGVITSDKVLQPKVEAEIAFVLKKDLVGPNVTMEDVLEATAYVMPSFEIVDSRIADWNIQLQDTVADNASAGLYILGDNQIAADELDLSKVHMKVYKNGEFINEGLGAHAMGNPAYCVAWLANQMSEFGVGLKRGEVILSGTLALTIDAFPGDVFHATFEGLGEVKVTFGN